MQAVQNSALHKSYGDCLVVEDSDFDRAMIERVLERSFRNLRLHMAEDLHNARRILFRRPISFILLDNDLPDGMGANFVIELMKVPRLAKIPVIMVSDWPTPFMYAKAKEAKVLDVVKKYDLNGQIIRDALLRSPRPIRLY